MFAKSCASSPASSRRKSNVTATAEGNFAGRLVARLGQGSSLIDAATGRTIGPEVLPGLISSLGASLIAAGLKAGDRVLIGCSLSPSSALVYLGALYAGLVAVPVEERALIASTATLLAATSASAVWTETPVRSSGPATGTVLFLHGDMGGAGSLVTRPAPRLATDLAALMGTSGSTGVPRFVMVSHGNLIANTEAIIHSQGLAGDERAMLILPISYCFGASVVHSHLYQGGSIVFDRRFMFPNKVLQAAADFGCTTFAGVPTVYNVLLRRSNVWNVSLPALRRFLQAGGRLAAPKVDEMRGAFPRTKFYVMYGQTEATARISCLDPELWEGKQGSVGKPLDNLTVSIVDDLGNDLPAGQVGELLVNGPSICSGYWDDAEATRRTFRDGWLRTGDLARRDEDGYLWIEGRKEAFLKMRGVRVSFAEVEGKVTLIPGVDECAVLPVEHPEAGEAMALFIVPRAGATIREETVRRSLPAHWALDSVRLVLELPKTSSGKVARSLLAELREEVPCSNLTAK
jgi:acyl-CoA synthetase (AMP-forming)/AMP-acid ligase II